MSPSHLYPLTFVPIVEHPRNMLSPSPSIFFQTHHPHSPMVPSAIILCTLHKGTMHVIDKCNFSNTSGIRASLLLVLFLVPSLRYYCPAPCLTYHRGKPTDSPVFPPTIPITAELSSLDSGGSSDVKNPLGQVPDHA